MLRSILAISSLAAIPVTTFAQDGPEIDPLAIEIATASSEYLADQLKRIYGLILRGEPVYQVVRLASTSFAAASATLRLTKPIRRGTERVLIRFQRDVSLTPDGVTGSSTLKRLR